MTGENYYDAIYYGENNGGNPFATETAPRNNALHVHLRSGGSILTFRRPKPLPSFDAAISQTGALK